MNRLFLAYKKFKSNRLLNTLMIVNFIFGLTLFIVLSSFGINFLSQYIEIKIKPSSLYKIEINREFFKTFNEDNEPIFDKIKFQKIVNYNGIKSKKTFYNTDLNVNNNNISSPILAFDNLITEFDEVNDNEINGKIPTQENEILITENGLRLLGINKNEALNKTIELELENSITNKINKKDYIITGIVNLDTNTKILNIYKGDFYIFNLDNKYTNFNVLVLNMDSFDSAKNIYNEYFEDVYSNVAFSFENLKNYVYFDLILAIILFIISICLLIIFISSGLFIEKLNKEENNKFFDYLNIFGFSKKDNAIILLEEKLYLMVITFLISVLLAWISILLIQKYLVIPIFDFSQIFYLNGWSILLTVIAICINLFIFKKYEQDKSEV